VNSVVGGRYVEETMEENQLSHFDYLKKYEHQLVVGSING
jgi:hypothetical protein